MPVNAGPAHLQRRAAPGGQGWVVVVGAAVIAWVLAGLVTVVEWTIFRGGEGGRQAFADLFTIWNLLIPVFSVPACLATNLFLRKGLTLASAHRHWTAGAWFAAASVLTVAGFAVVLGGMDAIAYVAYWAVFSGYAVLLWLAGAWVWKKTPYDQPHNALWDSLVED